MKWANSVCESSVQYGDVCVRLVADDEPNAVEQVQGRVLQAVACVDWRFGVWKQSRMVLDRPGMGPKSPRCCRAQSIPGCHPQMLGRLGHQSLKNPHRQ